MENHTTIPPVPEVDSRQTKAQIFDAYKQVKGILQQYKENAKQSVSKQTQRKKGDEYEVIKKTKEETVETVSERLTALRKEFDDVFGKEEASLHSLLDDVAEKLTAEANRLSDIREAIRVEQTRLEEIYTITVEADTLSNLIRAQEEAQREREREEEEYSHERDLNRAREQSQHKMEAESRKRKFEEDIEAREKVFQEREMVLKSKEKELKEALEKVDAFPKELEKAVIAEREKTVRELNREWETKSVLEQSERQGEKERYDLTIVSLKQTVAEQKQYISRLENQLEHAIEKNQQLASTVIEGVSRVQLFSARREEAEGERKEKREKGE
jgi:hypothetical protein